jgi:hypothetical protein
MATPRRFNKIFDNKKEARSCEVLLFFAKTAAGINIKINTQA